MKHSQLLYPIILSILIHFTAGEFTAEDCKAVGFNKATLLCSTCKQFSAFKLPNIGDLCNECCIKEDDTSAKRYPRAVLEVCTCKFNTYPQIKAFVDSDRPKQFKNLEIKYLRGLDPIVKLYNADGQVADTLDIHKWDTDDVVEFFQTHLVQN